MGFRYVSIFSGVEAASLAWEPLGWEPVAFSEIEPFPCAVLAERWPDIPNLGDITKINWKEEIDEAIDLVVGGSPCQSFSVAGKREGLKGASGLMFEYIRCVQELRPRWFLWENVPGALTSEDGGAFGQLLSEMDELGYGLAWRVLDAQFFGVAQRRRRLFLVGHLGDGTLSGALAARPGMKQTTFVCTGGTYPINEQVATRDKKLGRGTGLGVGADGDPAFTLLANHPHMVASGSRSNPIATGDLNAHTAICRNVCLSLKCGGNGAMVASEIGDKPTGVNPMLVRRLTPLECERLQGFPDGHTLIAWKGKPAEECPDGPRYKAIGNSMAVPVMRWIGKRIAAVDKN